MSHQNKIKDRVAKLDINKKNLSIGYSYPTGVGSVVKFVLSDIIPNVNTAPNNQIMFPAFKTQKLIVGFQKIFINPALMNFYPKEVFSKYNYPIQIDGLKKILFCKRSNRIIRFEHKLWNALQIVHFQPSLFPICGVRWYNNSIIIVDIDIFGKLIGTMKPQSALCNSSGYFATHGFEECTKAVPDIGKYLAYKHTEGKFTLTSTEEDINQAKWVKSS